MKKFEKLFLFRQSPLDDNVYFIYKKRFLFFKQLVAVFKIYRKKMKSNLKFKKTLPNDECSFIQEKCDDLMLRVYD